MKYEVLEILGEKVLFTPAHLFKLDEQLDDFECYEIRHSDEGFKMCEIARRVRVNHYGSIISRNEIPLTDFNCKYIDETQDVKDLNEMMSLEEYREEGIVMDNDHSMELKL